MEDLIVQVTVKRTSLALEEIAKLMEVGQVGHLGQVVKAIARNQELEVATIQFLQMEVLNVLATTKRTMFVLVEIAKLKSKVCLLVHMAGNISVEHILATK